MSHDDKPTEIQKINVAKSTVHLLSDFLILKINMLNSDLRFLIINLSLPL